MEWRLPRGRSLIAEEKRAEEMGVADDDMVSQMFCCEGLAGWLFSSPLFFMCVFMGKGRFV